MKIKIIEATNADTPLIINMLTQLYLELGEEKDSITFLNDVLIKELLANNKTLIYKATNDDETIGILSLTESQAMYAGGYYGVIDEMYVLPEYRSKGVGALLVTKAIELAANRSWKRIDVTAPTDGNPKTVKFYEKCGFSFTGPKLKISIVITNPLSIS